MNRCLSLVRLLCVVFGVCFCASVSSAQNGTQRAASLISAEDYRRVLDSAFAEATSKKDDLQYSLVLRFMSSRHAESEVALQVSNDGQVHAILMTITGSSVWTTANEYLQRKGKLDIGEIVRLVHLTRQPLPISAAQASTWHAEMLKSLGVASTELQREFIDLQKSGEATIFLDGTTYELEFTQGLSEIRWITLDAEVDDHDVTGRSSFVKWMNTVRTYSFSHATQ